MSSDYVLELPNELDAIDRAVAFLLERGEEAFLHAYADRTATIALYETLGFRVRTPVTYTVLDGPA